MKKLNQLLALVVMAFGFASCGESDDYMVFVGTWGLERIEYYTPDYAGNPIPETVMSFNFTPGDPDNGIDLIFRSDKSGEMRDRSRDTIFMYDSSTEEITDTIICPDTTIVSRFTYTYHEGEPLYMNMETAVNFKMEIEEINDDRFVYVNQYRVHDVEKAWMVRISDDTKGKRASANKPANRILRPGSMLSNY